MAAPSRILALFVDLDGPDSLKYIETETNPSTGPSPPEGTSPFSQQVEYMRQLLCTNDLDLSDPDTKKLGLPINQPKCPREWDAEAWDKRVRVRNARLHIFYAGGSFSKVFILKVSNTTDPNGKLFYEDVDPAFPASTRAELGAIRRILTHRLESVKFVKAILDLPDEGLLNVGKPYVAECLHYLYRLSC